MSTPPKPVADTRPTALVAGGSGMVGNQLLRTLVAAPDVARIIAVSRRPLVYDHAKVANRIVRVDKLEESLSGTKADVAFCCLGTTMAAARSEAAFRLVDYDLVLAFARAALKAGARRFVLVSSVGADPRSKIFYLRVKGETEAALETLGFGSLDILQPGILLGSRTQLRPLELVATVIMPVVNPLLLGKLEPYRGVSASKLAAAMLGALRSVRKGTYRYTHRGITDLARAGSRPPR